MKQRRNGIKIAIFTAIVLTFIIGGYFLSKNAFKKEDPKPEIKYSDATPLLYKASDGKTDIYLLGSIHAADDSAYEFNKNILDIYNKTDALAVEFDIIDFENDIKAQTEMLSLFMYESGTLKDNIDPDLYNLLTGFLKDRNLYSNMYEAYKLDIWQSLLENELIVDAGLNANKGIDRYFLKKAKKENKKIIEVESAEFQYNLMLEVPETAVLLSIRETINEYEESVQALKDLYSIWKEGNAEKVVEVLSEDIDVENDYTAEEIEAVKTYNKMLLTDRNVGMTDVLEENIKNGTSVFCVVGLAHVVGDDGIVDLLEDRGYTVELVDYSSL